MQKMQSGDEWMPHELSQLGLIACQIGRIIRSSITQDNDGDSCEKDAVGDRSHSPLRRDPANDPTEENITM